MRSENRAFQLEATYPGIFLLQGWLGGILGGYMTMLSICLLNDSMDPLAAVLWMPLLVIPGSILAVVKATILWAGYRLTGIQLGAAGRVVASAIVVGLLALFTAFQFEIVDQNYLRAWVGTLVVASLPTALLVGSLVKPWELCTFGSMAVAATDERVGSKSVLTTLGTLPLRFLSLGGLAVWILTVACQRDIETIRLEVVAALSVSLIYLLFSTYVTFRSPRKTILLVAGLVVNLPVAGLAVLAYLNDPSDDFLPEMLVAVGVICTTFLVGWVLFLAARMSVPTHRIFRADLNAALLRAFDQHDHECLGSRFLEWRESEAR